MTRPRKSLIVLVSVQIGLIAVAAIAVFAISLSQVGNSQPVKTPDSSQQSPALLVTASAEPPSTPTTVPSEAPVESPSNNVNNGNDGVYNMYKGQTGFVVASVSPDGYSFTLVEKCTTGWVKFSVVTDAGSFFGDGGSSCEIGKYGMAGMSNYGMIETAKSWFCGGSAAGNSFRAVSEGGSTTQWYPVFAEWKDCPEQYVPNPGPVG